VRDERVGQALAVAQLEVDDCVVGADLGGRELRAVQVLSYVDAAVQPEELAVVALEMPNLLDLVACPRRTRAGR
jgi:hypothetical protein